MSTETDVEQAYEAIAREQKQLLPGTLGWTAADLDDPRFDGPFASMPYEISDGVLTLLPPAYFSGGAALTNLTHLVTQHLRVSDPTAVMPSEVDLILSPERVAKVDAMYLAPDELRVQRTRDPKRDHPQFRISRIVVAPTLIVESVSLGHERRDRIVKFDWFESFGVKNYWLLDAQRRTFLCYALVDRRFQLDAEGKGVETVSPRSFPGLAIDLRQVWYAED